VAALITRLSVDTLFSMAACQVEILVGMVVSSMKA
jgi:hypothetical protein